MPQRRRRPRHVSSQASDMLSSIASRSKPSSAESSGGKPVSACHLPLNWSSPCEAINVPDNRGSSPAMTRESTECAIAPGGFGMHLPPQDAVLLRIFIGEDDRADGRPLYEALVLKAREMGLAGATVLRGPMGFGPKTRRLHTAKILQLSTDLPMIVEIVDSEEHIRTFLEAIDPMMPSGLVTLEKATIIRYGKKYS